METISAADSKAVLRAAEVLREGGVVLYPTDTVYGIGVDALNVEAIKKIYMIKGRSAGNPISVVVPSLDAAEVYVAITPGARKLAKAFWPGPLTVVLRRKETVPGELTGDRETLGIRVPNNTFCLALARELGRPYTTTSANKAGTGDCRTIEEVSMSLGEHFNGIDLVIDGGQLPTAVPSTVVDVSGITPHIFREGAVPSSHVLGVLEG